MSELLSIDVHAKRFGARPVLQGVRTHVAAGEIVSLVGASGCGKSTLLRIVAGLDADFTGSVRLDGREQRGPRREVGFVFQEPRLFPWLTVAANVAFETGEAGRADARVDALLAEVGLAGYGGALPKQLSGGQAQRVAIARSLFANPRLLLMDEPFSAVDAFTRMKLQDLVADVVRQHGVALLVVTHDIDEAAYLSDRVLVMDSAPGTISRDIVVEAPRPRRRGEAGIGAARATVFDALHAVHAL